MTALAGYLGFDNKDPASCCAAMLEAQAIYGHETILRTAGPLSLGRRLWPITPEDSFDTGPLSGANGRLLLCADARIDNRSDLAAALSLAGPLNRISDAALILAAYEKWGDAAFGRLFGAFAVIIWDSERRLLTLARDPLGERPLHYHIGDSFIAVGSMAKGLHAIPAVPYAARTHSMADFLALMPETGSEIFFEQIEKVVPGHIVVLSANGRVRDTAYWNPSLDPMILASDADYAAALREALDQAVSCRLRRASGGIGSHLSAGLDSSSVTATAARLCQTERMFAFTATPSIDIADQHSVITDEGPLAAATAQLYPNVDHVMVQTGGVSPLAGLDRHFRLYERPILNPCNAVWNDAINDHAQARGVRVMLTGQMGNLSFSHGGMQQLSMLARAAALPELAVLLARMLRRGHRWPALAAQSIGPFMPPALWAWLTRKLGRGLDLGDYSALRPSAYGALGVESRAQQRGLDPSYRPWADSRAMRLWALRRVDLGVYNKGTLAGWGIDLRDPTADRRLIEFMLRIPERQFILNGETRSLARRAFADRLPAAVVSEHRRGLQAADWHLAMAAAHPAIGEELAVLERNPQARAIIDIERLKRAHSDWPEADPQAESTTRLYRQAMMRALAAGHFLRKVGRTN